MEAGAIAARRAGLRYVAPAEPGYARKRKGKRFTIVERGGARVKDQDALDRFSHLAIPPAWRDVWICRDADGHLQATGYDARGRKQYLYHAEWAVRRSQTKFHHVVEFANALPGMRKRIADDMGRRGLPRERVVACVVDLLEKTLIRVGNSEYAKTNASYGLTTIRNDHVEVHGGRIRFTFKGKSNKHHDIEVSDPRAARIVKRCQELPGHELFCFLDDAGVVHDITSSDVNTYLATSCCGEFTAKDFRTWGGTVRAFELLRAIERSPVKRTADKQVVAVIREVAAHLGNTPAMSRRYYIHPAILAGFLDGKLARARLPRRAKAGLSLAETQTLAFLTRRA